MKNHEGKNAREAVLSEVIRLRSICDFARRQKRCVRKTIYREYVLRKFYFPHAHSPPPPLCNFENFNEHR